jgi:hypothetical protein
MPSQAQLHHEPSQLKQQGAPVPAQHASTPTHPPQAAKKRPRSTRSVRRPVRYTQFFDSLDDDAEKGAEEGAERGDSEAWQYSDSDAEEDARIERSMGVIRKNAASRGSEGGTKYHCDVSVYEQLRYGKYS